MANYYNKDLYKILEINFEASSEEIKQSYRKLVRKYHPDVSSLPEDEKKFKDVQEAYEILSDSTLRHKYDVLHGFYREKIKKTYNEKYEQTINKAKQHANQSASFSDSINEALENLFSNKKNSSSASEKKEPINGEDINLDISISCFEAINGTSRKVNILHTQPCTNCQGRKFINGSECAICNGVGQLSVQKKLNVKIPKGVKQGAKIRIKKEGNKGLNGGSDGDLYLLVNIEKNPYYEIDGLNILCNMPITPYEAVLGSEVKLNIMGENVAVKIPAMTSSGQKLKLSQLGLHNKSKSKRGDIIITVVIKLPETMSEEEKQLYSKLAEVSKSDVRKDFNNAK